MRDEALARRVLLAWSIKSSRLLKQVNIEEWMKQEEASGAQMTRISEMTTSASMYTTRRLRLLGMAAREPELMRRFDEALVDEYADLFRGLDDSELLALAGSFAFENCTVRRALCLQLSQG